MSRYVPTLVLLNGRGNLYKVCSTEWLFVDIIATGVDGINGPFPDEQIPTETSDPSFPLAMHPVINIRDHHLSSYSFNSSSAIAR